VRAEVFYWYCGCTLNVLLPELQVTSKKDQEQYWYDQGRPYQYVPVAELANAFRDFRVGKELDEQLSTPFDKSRSHPAALVNTKYALSSWNILKACVEREALLIKRNRFLYIFRTCQVGIHDLYSSASFLTWIWRAIVFFCLFVQQNFILFFVCIFA
jgi:hypothetical protein